MKRRKNEYRRRCRTCGKYFTAYNVRREFCPDTNCDDILNNAKKWIVQQVEKFGVMNQADFDEKILARLCTGASASIQRFMLDVHGFGFKGKRKEPMAVIERFYPEYHYKRFVLRELPEEHYIIIRQKDNGWEFH